MTICMSRLGPMPPESQSHMATLDRVDGLDGKLSTEHGKCLRFVFRPIASLYESWTATAMTSLSLNEHSCLGVLLRGMIGIDAFNQIEDGADVTELICNLIDESFELVIEHRKNEHGVTFINVVSATRVADGDTD